MSTASITTTDGVDYHGRSVGSIVRRVYGRRTVISWRSGPPGPVAVVSDVRTHATRVVLARVEGPVEVRGVETVRDAHGVPRGTVEGMWVRGPRNGARRAWVATRSDEGPPFTVARRADAVAIILGIGPEFSM